MNIKTEAQTMGFRRFPVQSAGERIRIFIPRGAETVGPSPPLTG